MLKIYGSARSRGRRTLWMAKELGLAYEHLDYAPRSPETRTAAFLALNPNGSVPVIDDDGFVLPESMAINIYLARKHNKLLPGDAKADAQALQWSLWETDRLDRQMTNYVNNTTVLPEAQRNKMIADLAWADIEPAMNVLDGHLAKNKWLVGNDFSVADLNVAGALYRCLFMDLSRWPNAKSWLERCWERPAAKAVRAMCE